MPAWSVGKQGPLTVTRRTGGSRGIDGRWDAGSETTFEIHATVNPIPGDVLRTLPEGEAVGKQLRVLTEAELNTADDYSGEEGDRIEIRGELYEVRDVQIYEKVLPHFEYRVRRIRPNPTSPY